MAFAMLNVLLLMMWTLAAFMLGAKACTWVLEDKAQNGTPVKLKGKYYRLAATDKPLERKP